MSYFEHTNPIHFEEYTFTGFYPSGDSIQHYYDESKKTMFTSSISVQTWDRAPKVGDKVKFEKHGHSREVNAKIWINDELVYTHSAEKELEIQQIVNGMTEALLREKGLTLNQTPNTPSTSPTTNN